METTNKVNAVNVNEVSTVKAVASGAKNAALYSVEKPLVGLSIILRSAAAVLEFGSAASMAGAVKLHTVRKDEASAEAMVSSVNDGFAACEQRIDAIGESLQNKIRLAQEKIAKAKAAKAAIAEAAAEEKAIELLQSKGYEVK